MVKVVQVNNATDVRIARTVLLPSTTGNTAYGLYQKGNAQAGESHQKLLAAIRKAEEAEMTNEETISPESDSAQENSDASEEADRPLSYYL